MKILVIDACVRNGSRTRKLTEHLLEYLHGDVTKVYLNELSIAPYDSQKLAARDEALSCGRTDAAMFEQARLFAEADLIVFAAPYWDFGMPALLRCYIERIQVGGVTFHYNEQDKCETLCRAKKLYYVSTAGGEVHDGNLGFVYTSSVAGYFWGIKDCVLIQAENLDLKGQDSEAILRDAMAEIDRLFE